MRVLVIGASRGIGRETISALAACGHAPVGFSRTLPVRGDAVMGAVPWITGDALDPDAVAEALDGIEAVVQCLGVSHSALLGPISLFSRATDVLVAAMTRRDLRRLIAVTGFGAGRSRAAIPLWQKVPFELAFGRAYRDKDIQERLISESPLDWTLVRPGVLTNGPGTGRYKVIADPADWRNGVISRKDVAAFLAAQVADRTWIGRDVVVIR